MKATALAPVGAGLCGGASVGGDAGVCWQLETSNRRKTTTTKYLLFISNHL
jgi:hypothetical protein